MDDDRELLLELVTNAWRPPDRWHPAWHDLPPDARREAYDRTVEQRRLEAALDPEGLSTTARRVLQRIRDT